MYDRITLKRKDLELLIEQIRLDAKDPEHVRIYLHEGKTIQVDYEDKNHQQCEITLRSINGYMGPQIKKMMPLREKK